MMRKCKEFSIVILTFIIVIPLFIACSSSRTAITKDEDVYIDNIITSRNENGTTVDIVGNDLQNFNAFQLHDKRKLIIDLPEARFQEIPELGDVNIGCVDQIKVFQFAEDEKRLARIEIDLYQEVFPEFNENSDRISINLAHQDLSEDEIKSTSIASLDPTQVLDQSQNY